MAISNLTPVLRISLRKAVMSLLEQATVNWISRSSCPMIRSRKGVSKWHECVVGELLPRWANTWIRLSLLYWGWPVLLSLCHPSVWEFLRLEKKTCHLQANQEFSSLNIPLPQFHTNKQLLHCSVLGPCAQWNIRHKFWQVRGEIGTSFWVPDEQGPIAVGHHHQSTGRMYVRGAGRGLYSWMNSYVLNFESSKLHQYLIQYPIQCRFLYWSILLTNNALRISQMETSSILFLFASRS